MKTLQTLVPDIYDLFSPDKEHKVTQENLDEFANTIKELLRTRLSGRDNNDPSLRFSSLGRPDRQIYLSTHRGDDKEALTPKTYFKFLYGDIIEALVLFLAKEAGHKVELQQHEVSVQDVKGHIDAVIDGVLVDVKSASPHGYKKFKQSIVIEDDPFGYVAQLAGYSNVLTNGEQAAWVAFDKVSGDICVSYLPSSIIKDHQPSDRITHLKEILSKDELPPICYEPIPDGKSGNMKLATGCSYCAFKKTCFPELRTFYYSTGPRFLTKVVREPDVPELLIGTLEEPEVTD
jgi:hypothetical protein